MIRRHWLALVVCVGLAVAHTWPLAADPGSHSRNDTADALLNEWILAWVAHQLPRDPLHLFDANIFHPSKDALAFSEPLIVPGAMSAPVAWFGGSPVLAYNLVALAGLVLTALATWRLVLAWTGDRAAAALAAGAFAFNAHTLTRLPHVQGLHLYGLPLALLAADRLLTRARTRDAGWLALWMTTLVYTSGYTAVFGIFMIGAVLLSRPREWWGVRAAPVLGRFALAAVLAGLASLPVYLPFQRVAETQGMVRSIASVDLYSATFNHYLAAAGRVHFSTWSEPFFAAAGDAYFPGVLVVVLVAVAIWWGMRGRAGDDPARPADLTRRRIGMLVAIGAVGVLLSLGTHTPLYGWLFEIFPPIRGMRAASRFGTLFMLSTACLAGFGLWFLRARFAGRRWIAAAAVAVIIVANIETAVAPIPYHRFEGIPSLYAELADIPGDVVLVEIPLYRRHQVFRNAAYVLASTAHWRPLVNGYSGYVPREYREYSETFRGFPSDQSLAAMREAGVTHVMLHPARFPANAEAVMGEMAVHPAFEHLGEGPEGMTLYRLRGADELPVH